jgi:hypothetical protein
MEHWQPISRRYLAAAVLLLFWAANRDIEQRIAQVYQTCRNADEIKSAFDKLQDELE